MKKLGKLVLGLLLTAIVVLLVLFIVTTIMNGVNIYHTISHSSYVEESSKPTSKPTSSKPVSKPESSKPVSSRPESSIAESSAAVSSKPESSIAESSAAVPSKPESSIAESSKPEASSVDQNKIRSDFKEAMDAYESFYNEYVEFLKKYQKNPTDFTLLAQYGSMLSKAAEFDQKMLKWDSEDLTLAEAAYMVEVQGRISKKLLEVGMSLG